MSYYDDLEVHPRVSPEVLKAAYHALSKRFQAGLGGDDHNTAQRRINAAYEVLSDPKKRKDYDKFTAATTGTVIGNYRLLEQIAEGGFGVTYKGEHILTGEPVCVKHCSEISAAHDAVLIQEAKAVWDLRHYALPVMRDMLRLEDKSLALIQSYVPGPTLEQVVEKAKKIEAEDVAWITERILNALLYLHHHGVIHGDLKPQNIIVQPETHAVVLVDFGLAMVKPSAAAKAIGYTPLFSPPEQIQGKPLLPASDYYALGMCMIFALCGGERARVEKKAVPNSVPAAMCDFIQQVTRRDILSRPQGDLFEDFQKVRQVSFGRTRSGMKPIAGL